MPLGSFRLNGLAKKLAAVIAGWASWNGTKDGSYASMGQNTLVNFLPINDDRGVLVTRTGFYNISKSGTTITLGTLAGTANGSSTTGGNDSPGGYAIVDSTGTTGYYLNPEYSSAIYKFGSMTSSGVGTFGAGTISQAGYNGLMDAKVRSDGKIVAFGTRYDGTNNQICRYIFTVTGTTSLSVSTTYTDLGTTFSAAAMQSISIIDDNTAIVIAGTSGSLKAYSLGSTITQIGSTYTTAIALLRGFNPNVLYRLEQTNLKHGYALAMGRNSSNQLVFFKATSGAFTNFTISNPYNDPTQPETGSLWNYVSLDENHVMVRSSTNTYKGGGYSINNLLVNATTGAAVRAAGDGDWEEKGRQYLKPWGANQLFASNWQSVRVIKIV